MLVRNLHGRWSYKAHEESQRRKTKPMHLMLTYISLCKCSEETYERPINATSVHPHNLKQAIWGSMQKTQRERPDICNHCDYKCDLHKSRHRINSQSKLGILRKNTLWINTLWKNTIWKNTLRKKTRRKNTHVNYAHTDTTHTHKIWQKSAV